MTLHPFRQAIWGQIWKLTVEKSRTNAISVTTSHLGHAIWGHIWKHTVEKKQTNATSVTLHSLKRAIWGYIWKHTVEKSQTNATNVVMHLFRQPIWGHIWKGTAAESGRKVGLAMFLLFGCIGCILSPHPPIHVVVHSVNTPCWTCVPKSTKKILDVMASS